MQGSGATKIQGFPERERIRKKKKNYYGARTIED